MLKVNMMEILKQTISLCPICRCDIPATINNVDGMVIMRKICPEHGMFNGIVEQDAEFYKMVQRHNSPQFYGGMIIDVTYRCNLRCKWCFQHLTGENVPVQRIYNLARQMPIGSHIILSGGEPTLRGDLQCIINTLVEMGMVVNVLTNGFNIDWSLPCSWTLSHHQGSEGTFNHRIAEAEDGGHKFDSIIFTDSNLFDYYEHVKQGIALRGIAGIIRMHMAAPVGDNSTDPHSGVFVSDMYKHLITKGHKLSMSAGKTSFAPVMVDGVQFMLISWPTIENTDVLENHCQPWYHGKGNSADNIVTRMLRDN